MDIRLLIAQELPRLRRYARALLVGDPHGADDLVQETLERALQRTHLFQQDTNLRAWLFTILHNINANNCRKKASRPREVWNEDVPESTFAESPSVEAKLALHDMSRALGQLAEEQRQVVLLVGLEGMSYKEAANVVGVPMGTIMSRLARGREILHELMDQGASKPALRRVK